MSSVVAGIEAMMKVVGSYGQAAQTSGVEPYHMC